jgi:hypothetical protein
MGIAVERLPSGLDSLTRYLDDPSTSREDRATLLRIAENLAKPASPFEPRGGGNSFGEVLYVIRATTTVNISAAETVMVPDFTIPANYLIAGRCLRYTLLGDYSSHLSTAETWTFRIRYGGVAGTLLAASGAFPIALNRTNSGFMVEWYVMMLTEGAAGSAFVMGRVTWTGWPGTAALIASAANMLVAPVSAPAAVTINTTTATALSVTTQTSAAVGSTRTNMGILESMN